MGSGGGVGAGASLCRPEENGEQQKRLKGERETCEQFCEWASWSWLKPLRECIATGSDYCGLARCGLIVDNFDRRTGALTGNLAVMEAEVASQQALFEQYWLLVRSMLNEHGTSCMHFSAFYPFAAAGLLSTDASAVERSRALLRSHALAYEAAMDHQTPAIAALMAKHPFHSTYMQIGLRIGKVAELEHLDLYL